MRYGLTSYEPAPSEDVPIAGLFLRRRDFMLGAIKSKRPIAEGCIDKSAMMLGLWIRIHIRPKIFAGHAEALCR
ncbi:hypothetical protein CU048_05940 [Beijerinckiaceae bacterium]|nr:hypothetical protein CU048_05940 [Beijerinckiaceae bacterium]